ncbi:hypothetical protein [Clostridium arbusti]|uniref:hypothetical protein n=1 Tax=Clostridium arbusti TaxID=1137848 RepID=UPI00028A1E81|nr:hypothetical protein [Clostridium arbusti]
MKIPIISRLWESSSKLSHLSFAKVTVTWKIIHNEIIDLFYENILVHLSWRHIYIIEWFFKKDK